MKGSLLLAALVLALPFARAAQNATASPDIATLRDLHLDTVLVAQGVSQCRIVAPLGEALQEQGRRVQAALSQACGVKIEFLDPGAITEDVCRRFNLILLGNMGNNPAIARLYTRRYVFTDAFYPGKDGYEVRTIHNPMGWGRNSVLLGGSDDAGVRAATDRFLALLRSEKGLRVREGGQSVKLGWLLSSASSLNPAQKADAGFVAATVKSIRQKLDNGVVRPQMGDRGILDAGMSYYLSGQEGWGRIFRESLLHYYDLARAANDWALIGLSNDPGGQYFWPWKLAIVWEDIEADPVFSDADRLKITNLLFHLTEWVADCDHFHLDRPKGAQYDAPGDLRQNHATYAALSMFFGAEYFRMYYPSIREFEPRYRDLARTFDGQAGSYKSDDNATVYSPLAPSHYLTYRLALGPLDAQEKRNLRALADAAIIATDNRGDASTFGDIPVYPVGSTRVLSFLSRAAWQFQDAGDRWAFDWIERRSRSGRESKRPAGDNWYEGLEVTDGPRIEPSRLSGIALLRVDQGLYDFMGRKIRARFPQPVPPLGQCFDKLSFRRNFKAADEYLLLSGLSGVLVHSHEDGNSVLRLTWNDRIWLANLGYSAVPPHEHNSLMIRRGGQAEAMPAFTRLESQAELPAAGFTRTTVPGYNGMDWSRNIFWEKGKYFLFFDEATARQPGDYQLQLVWRTLGETKLADNRLEVTQDGETFTIASADGSRKNLSRKKSDSNSDWTPYPHADGTVKILSEMRDLKAGAGTREVYVNLLYPGDPKRFALERIGSHTVRIRSGAQDDALVGLAAGGNECGDFRLQAAAYRIGREGLSVFDARRISLGGLELRCDRPISLELDWAAAAGTLRAAQDTVLDLTVPAVRLDGRRIEASAGSGSVRFPVSAGIHRLALEGKPLAPLAPVLDRDYPLLAETAAPAAPVRALTRLWQFKAPGPVQALASGDLEGKGNSEVVVAAGNQAIALTAAGVKKWSFRTEEDIACLQIVDFAHDGKKAIAIGAGSTLTLLDAGGKEKWRYECDYLKSPLSAMISADLEGDGRTEILAGNTSSVLFAVNADGTLRWRSFQEIGRSGIVTLLAADFDGNGKSEIFVGTGRDHGAVLLGHDGRQARWTISGTHHVASFIAENGRQTLLIGGPQKQGPVRLLDPRTGDTRKFFPVKDDAIAAVSAQLEGQGGREFVLAFKTAGLFVLDPTGKIRRHRTFDSFPSSLALGNFAADGKPGLAVGAQDGKLWIVDGQLATEATAELPASIEALAAFRAPLFTGLVAGAADGTVVLFTDPSRQP